MTIADTYDTGTVSVDSSGNVTGSGVIWSLVKKFDLISIDGGDLRTITEVTDSSHLKIQPWSGTASAKPYVIYYNSLLRLTNGELALRTQELVKTITGDGYFVYVGPDDTEPDPAKGKDGQYALKPSTGATWLKASGVWNSISVPREVLTAARTYYVRTDGSDSNTGLANTSGGAFLTLQKAFDTVYGTLDLNRFDVAINVGAGTYTNGIVVSSPQVGNGNISLIGDISTPSNVLISVSSGDCIYVNCATSILVRGLKLANPLGYGLHSGAPGARLNYGNIEFGTCSTMIRADYLGLIQNKGIGDITVSGGGDRCVSAGQGGIVFMQDHTITLTGTPAFSQAFAYTVSGQIGSHNMTYSGSATGLRYSASANGVINTFGSGANLFPGDVAGTTATGGQYL